MSATQMPWNLSVRGEGGEHTVSFVREERVRGCKKMVLTSSRSCAGGEEGEEEGGGEQARSAISQTAEAHRFLLTLKRSLTGYPSVAKANLGPNSLAGLIAAPVCAPTPLAIASTKKKMAKAKA